MAIIAAGVRYDANKVIQAVVVITDEDGKGHTDHLNPHRLDAANKGHGWLNIDPLVYSAFTSPADLAAHVSAALPALIA